MPCDHCAALLPRLEDAERQLEAVAQRVAQLERRRTPLAPSDLVALSRILPVAAGSIGSTPFTVRELFERDDPALRVALAGRNRHQVGRLLARAVGHAVNDLVVLRLGVEHGAKLWKVARVVAR
jgi:hypothetical protein